MIGRQSRRAMNIALVAHVGVALAGFVALVVWVAGSMRS
jgi:hypothetical protein